MVTRGSSSHIWCEGCHKRRVHATSPYQRCRSCTSQYKHALKEERRRIKQTRALRRPVVLPPIEPEPERLTIEDAILDVATEQRIDRALDDMITGEHVTRDISAKAIIARDMIYGPPEETPTVVKPKPTPPSAPVVAPAVETSRRSPTTTEVYASWERVASRLPEDVRLEIGAHYENLDVTVEGICKEYGIGLGVLMAIVRDLNLTRRTDRPDFKHGKRNHPGYFSLVDGKHIWMSGRKPTASTRAYEKGLRDARPRPAPVPVALDSALPVHPEPREPMPAVHAVGFEDQPLWLVSIEAVIEVRAERIEDAITQARVKYPHARIRGVNIG